MSTRQIADKLMVRLPDGLRDRVKESAEQNCRTMNAEVVFHLKNALFDPLETQKPAAQS